MRALRSRAFNTSVREPRIYSSEDPISNVHINRLNFTKEFSVKKKTLKLSRALAMYVASCQRPASLVFVNGERGPIKSAAALKTRQIGHDQICSFIQQIFTACPPCETYCQVLSGSRRSRIRRTKGGSKLCPMRNS